MANIFKQSLDVTQHPNRNNHDLSHKVHGSYKMGVLYPFLCHPVVPNDSFRIDTACAFQLMPMPFPTQTNIRCIFHYFYVRNKNIWENWENWLQGLEQHTPPYINQPATFYKTGSLADHLGIPTTFASSDSVSAFTSRGTQLSTQLYESFKYLLWTEDSSARGPVLSLSSPWVDDEIEQQGLFLEVSSPSFKASSLVSVPPYYFQFSGSFNYQQLNLNPSLTDEEDLIRVVKEHCKLVVMTIPENLSPRDVDYLEVVDVKSLSDFRVGSDDGISVSHVVEADNHYCVVSLKFSTSSYMTGFKDYLQRLSVTGKNIVISFGISCYNPLLYRSYSRMTFFGYLGVKGGIAELSSIASNPYYSSTNSGTDTVKISALPFRAYESIIRCYYKNSVLQPLKIDGVEKYNRYNTELGDGADSTDYVLEQRNWELDAYTSCLPSPQQGNTPLVGITDSGRGVIEDPETGERLRFTATRDSENGTESIEVEGGEGLENMRTLVNLSRSNTSGITIPDIRNVNALQRFLEQSIRSGYKYIDFIKGHFGSEPKYAELDMPEFLGGFTQRVDVNMISNSNGVVPTDAEDIALGSFAGQARAFGGAKHGITRYFDDYGWLVGIMCIVPDNTYSQLLPKWFTYTDRLSYFFPEFAQTNLQPITYSEVCPIQSHAEYAGGATGHLLTDTFGYQRPNHELVWCPDSLHGEFRKTLNNYVINRVFASRPELGDQFLKIDPEDTNRIFSYTEADNDVVVGQIAIKMTAKRPVPRIVIPSLGK